MHCDYAKKVISMISSNCIIQFFMMVIITDALPLTNSTKEVASVGGTQPQNKVSTRDKDPPRMGREHVVDKLPMNISNGSEVLATHNKSENASTTLSSNNGSFQQKPLNASDDAKVVTMKTNNSSIIVTKAKALNFTRKDSAINSTTIIQTINSTTSTTTMLSTNITKFTSAKPMKPLITEHDDVAINKKLESYSPSIPRIDATFEKKTKRADYVVPIVAVILSIPLVTIIFSLLLKRGKDWWQHRNYRRMDYLIEGMYNS